MSTLQFMGRGELVPRLIAQVGSEAFAKNLLKKRGHMNADGTLTAQGEKRNQMTAEERAFDRAGESVHTIDSINELATGTPASGTLNTLALFTSAVAVGDSTIVRSGAGATSLYTFGGGTAINNTSVTTEDLTTTGNTILGNAGTDTLTVNAASSFAADATFAAAADIVMSNTSKILLGTTMTIEHPLNGNAIISEVGGGNLSLFSDDTLEIKSGITGENYAKFTKDGPIELYYDNVKKFETTTTGVTVTGTQSSFSGQVTIPTTPVASTDAASKAYVDSQVGYSTYVARVSQTSTNAPVAVVISNNTGLTFTWSRMTGGDVSTGTTIVTIKDIGTAFATAVNTNLINGAAADNITAAFVEIRIYP